MSEYSGQNSSACGHPTLNNYNQGYNMGMPNPTPSSGAYIVPTWGAISYDALTGGKNPSCIGYGNIQTAYGGGAATCQTSYTTSLCNGGMLRQ
jgi:hypothetical protein